MDAINKSINSTTTNNKQFNKSTNNQKCIAKTENNASVVGKNIEQNSIPDIKNSSMSSKLSSSSYSSISSIGVNTDNCPTDIARTTNSSSTLQQQQQQKSFTATTTPTTTPTMPSVQRHQSSGTTPTVDITSIGDGVTGSGSASGSVSGVDNGDVLDDPETIESINRTAALNSSVDNDVVTSAGAVVAKSLAADNSAAAAGNKEQVPSDKSDYDNVVLNSCNVAATTAATTTTTTPPQQPVSNNDLIKKSDNVRNLSNSLSIAIDKCNSNNSFSIKPPDSLLFIGAGGKTLNDPIDDHPEQNDDIKPLLYEHENEKRKMPRGIVKSPSTKSFGNDGGGGSSSATNGVSFIESVTVERPVLHVQFRHNGGIPPMNGTTNECSSPASSVSSTSSSSGSSSSSDDEGSSSGQYSEAQPPDGGWGWVVVFASFIVNLIADGITFSFGVIFVEFLNYFGEGKGKTAWIGSLFMAMPLLSGPVASFLTDRYGCRKVTIAGSILACLGFVMSAFTTSMEMLFLTFGILAGFGLSLCYVAAVVIVAYYFDKRRSFATGLSVCGSGIGTFIFAPLTQMLIEHYGWRGTTLILAGFFLNMTVCGMLMRDLEWTTHRAKLRAKERKKNKLGISAESFSVSNSTNTGGTASNLHQQPFNIGEHDFNKTDPTLNPRLFSSLITLPTFIRNGEKVILGRLC